MRSFGRCRRQLLHIDKLRPQLMDESCPSASVLAALRDAQLVMYPGSHRHLPDEEGGKLTAPIEPLIQSLRAGDVLVFRQDVAHAGAASTGTELRHRWHWYTDGEVPDAKELALVVHHLTRGGRQIRPGGHLPHKHAPVAWVPRKYLPLCGSVDRSRISTTRQSCDAVFAVAYGRDVVTALGFVAERQIATIVRVGSQVGGRKRNRGGESGGKAGRDRPPQQHNGRGKGPPSSEWVFCLVWVSTELLPPGWPAIPHRILHWLLAILSVKWMPLFEHLVVIASACHQSGDAERRGMESV